jgi:uncharacterized protein DUF3891
MPYVYIRTDPRAPKMRILLWIKWSQGDTDRADSMIRRAYHHELLIIAQNDHAELAGKLVKHVGNSLFAAPMPLASVERAVAEHDRGWIRQDVSPQFNPEKLPAHVFEIDHAISLAAWTESVNLCAAKDPYAALLISLHSMRLAAHVANHLGPQNDQASRVQSFKVQQFLHLQIEIQEMLRRQLGLAIDMPLRGGLAERGASPEEDLLAANFSLMQLLDQISLNLCFDEVLFDRVGGIFPRPGAAPLTVLIDRPDKGVMRLDPWPFDDAVIDLKVPAKRMSIRGYRDETDLAAACAGGMKISLDVRVESL